MKKTIILALALILSLTSCGGVEDKDPAVLEVTTSFGNSFILRSFNDSNFTTRDAKSRVISEANKSPLYLKKDEVATAQFFCSACGHKEDVKLKGTDAFAKIFACKCPKGTQGLSRPKDEKEKKNWVPHQREYIALVVRPISMKPQYETPE